MTGGGPTLREHGTDSAPNGARAIARKDGIEVRRDLSAFSEEVVCLVTWEQIDHLRARVLDQR